MAFHSASGAQTALCEEDPHPPHGGREERSPVKGAGRATTPRGRVHWVLVTLLLLAGAAFRLYFILVHSSYMQSDEALVGLSTQHILTRGELPVFFWGEERSGALITYLVAPFFYVLGASNLVFKMVTATISLLLAYLLYLLARQVAGNRAGLFGLALAVFCPPFYLMWSVHAAAEYLLVMVIGVVMLLLCNALWSAEALAIGAGSPVRRVVAYGALGLAAGVGFWISPLVISFITAVWAINFLRDRRCFFRRTFPIFLLLFALGSIPALLFNARPEVREAGGLEGAPNWVSYSSLFGGSGEPLVQRFAEVPGTLLEIARASLPVLLGGALWEYETGLGRRLAVVVLLAFWLAAAVYALAARAGLVGRSPGRRRGSLPSIDVVALQFVLMILVFAVSPYRWLVREPRYLLPLFPFLLVSAALFVEEVWVKRKILAGTILAVILGLNVVLGVAFSESLDPDHGLWPKDENLLSFLVERGIRHPNANYWFAFSTAFETGEQVIPVPLGGIKLNIYPELLEREPSEWYVFRRRHVPEVRRYFEFFRYGMVGTQWSAEEFAAFLADLGVPHEDVQAHEFQHYTLFHVPARHLDPAALATPRVAASEETSHPAIRYLASVTRPGDALILNPAQPAERWLTRESVPAQYFRVPDQVPVQQGLLEAQMQEIGKAHQRLFLLLGDVSSSDPEGRVERWLDEHAYRADDRWLEDLRLVVYASPATAVEAAPDAGSRVRLGPAIEIKELAWSARVHQPGDIVALSVVWSAQQPVVEDYKAFVHLLDAGGQLAGQRDSEPVAGRMPTSSWTPGQEVQDRYGLPLPQDLPQGEYQLILGLYDPATGVRLPVATGTDATPADAYLLGSIRVAP